MDQYLSFGSWVRRRRRLMDITQADLARKINISLSMVRKIERDKRRPSGQVAELLADRLAIDDAQRPLFMQMSRSYIEQGAPALPDTDFDPPPNRRSRFRNQSLLFGGALLPAGKSKPCA